MAAKVASQVPISTPFDLMDRDQRLTHADVPRLAAGAGMRGGLDARCTAIPRRSDVMKTVLPLVSGRTRNDSDALTSCLGRKSDVMPIPIGAFGKAEKLHFGEPNAGSGEVPVSNIGCPSDIELGAWCDQRLSGEDMNVISTHLVSCSDCRRVAILVCPSIERRELDLGDSGRLRLLWVSSALRKATGTEVLSLIGSPVMPVAR